MREIVLCRVLYVSDSIGKFQGERSRILDHLVVHAIVASMSVSPDTRAKPHILCHHGAKLTLDICLGCNSVLHNIMQPRSNKHKPAVSKVSKYIMYCFKMECVWLITIHLLTVCLHSKVSRILFDRF